MRVEWLKVHLCWWVSIPGSAGSSVGAEHLDSIEISVCESSIGDERCAEAGLSLPVELGTDWVIWVILMRVTLI